MKSLILSDLHSLSGFIWNWLEFKIFSFDSKLHFFQINFEDITLQTAMAIKALTLPNNLLYYSSFYRR